MRKIKGIIIFFIAISILSAVAKGFNEAHHKEMAIEHCGGIENTEHYDAKGYKCKPEG